MKKEFNQIEILESAGCWRHAESSYQNLLYNLVNKYFALNKNITFKDVLNCPELSLENKRWWIFNSLGLTLKEKQLVALESAKSVANIYNKAYPNDKRVSLCINITARYLKGLVSLDTLIKYKIDSYSAAYAAAADTNGATHAAHAAYTAYAAYATAYAADVAYAADAAYTAAAYAADAAYATYAAYAHAHATAYAAYAADAAHAADATYAAHAAAAAYAAADAHAAYADAHVADAAYAAAAHATGIKLINSWIKILKTF